MVGIKGIWAAKHHLGDCGNLPQLRKPPHHIPHQYYKAFLMLHESVSSSQNIFRENGFYLLQPSNIRVYFHPTHTAKEKGGQVLLVSPPEDDGFGLTILGDCLALIFCYSVNFSCWLHI